MTNQKTEGRFENAKFDELCKVLLSEPHMGYFEALKEIGSEDIPSMYDVASVKRYFHKRGKLDVLKEPGIIFEEKDPEFKQLVLDGKIQKNTSFYSHCDNPDLRYMWTNEYLGMAPQGHPAEGNLIMAKVEGIDMSKRTAHPMGSFGSPDGMQDGQIIISKDKFVLIKDTNMWYDYDWHDDKYATHDLVWCGQIQGFEEINGLMVPITKGMGKYIAEQFVADADDNGFGDLSFFKTGHEPMALRPSSWSPMAFTKGNSINSRYKVLTKESLEKLL